MDYCTFVNVMMKKIGEEVSDGTVIQEHTVIRNNGKSRKGLVFRSPGINISPAIYLEEYYQKYRKGAALDKLAGEIKQLFEQVRFQNDFDESMLNDYEAMRPRIVFQLVNYKRNEARLQNMPYLLFHDLAICFYVLVDVKEQGMLTFAVDNSHLKLWGTDLEDICQNALENTPKLLHASFGGIDEVICELQRDIAGLPYIPAAPEGEECLKGMFILSNHVKNKGAAVLLYPHILEMIGDIVGNDFYILPSSIHEVIILTAKADISKAELEELVQEINETQLEEEEILSNHVYFFERKSKRILY